LKVFLGLRARKRALEKSKVWISVEIYKCILTLPRDFERRWVGRLRRKKEPRDSDVVVAASFLAALNW
jgi:hypothetical protein